MSNEFGWMSPRAHIAAKFAADAERIWGPGRGWQAACAKELDVSDQTVSNYVNGRTPIPASVTILVAERLEKMNLLTSAE